MANVLVEGVFMGCSIKTSNFEGVQKHKLNIDIYQADSESSNKMIIVSTDQIELADKIRKEFAQGSILKCLAYVNAYRNQAYFKLDKIIS